MGNIIKEFWKCIVGYNTLYNISNMGRTKRLKGIGCKIERILNPHIINKYGYQQVNLCKNGISKQHLVHRLVLENFIGFCPPGMECRHLDGNPRNNRLYNLKWGTRLENMSDVISRGARIKNRKLYKNNYIEINNIKSLEIENYKNYIKNILQINMSVEIWKNVVEYERIYEISNFGNARRIKNASGTCFGKILKPIESNRYGHQFINLHKSKKRKLNYIHRLVLEAFIGPCPEGMECRHLDGNLLNNKLDNLKWDTHKNNMMDRITHKTTYNGVHKSTNMGINNGQVKLSELQVGIIKHLLRDEYLTQTEISRVFNVHISTINLIKIGKTWKHITL